MVDTGDLKSLASNGVRVQVPPRAPLWRAFPAFDHYEAKYQTHIFIVNK